MRLLIQKYAPAKINLNLRILRKRTDGYHDIETVLLTIGLWDQIVLQKRDDQKIQLEIENSNIPADETNLCYRAARLFQERYSEFSGCHLLLKKKIPDGSGLGGGSSDAASTLLGLNNLFDLPFTYNELIVLAGKLGADVPFFMRNGLAIGRGIGNELDYVEKQWNFYVLVLCPNYKISTRWAYENYKISLTNEEKNVILKNQFLNEIQIDNFFEFFVNDFESLVFEYYPELQELKQALYHQGAFFASLSGTGSAVYGLFHERGDVDKAKMFFAQKNCCFVALPVYTNESGIDMKATRIRTNES